MGSVIVMLEFFGRKKGGNVPFGFTFAEIFQLSNLTLLLTKSEQSFEMLQSNENFRQPHQFPKNTGTKVRDLCMISIRSTKFAPSFQFQIDK